jgi:hypothetical protein
MIDLSQEAYRGTTSDLGYPELPKTEPFHTDTLGPWVHQRILARERLLADLERELTPAARREVILALDAFDDRVHQDVNWLNGYVAARCAANMRIVGRPAPGHPHHVDGTTSTLAFHDGYRVGLRDAARSIETWEPDLAEALFEEAELDDTPPSANPWRATAPCCPSCGTAEWVLCYDPEPTDGGGAWICIRVGHQGPDRFDAERAR